jgi:hypothetical protein
MSDRAAPELAIDRIPPRRPRWIEISTSAGHKDLGGILLTGAGGFLFLALIEFVLMRLQLVVPENTFLTPVTFNRVLSYYGATAIFFFALPFAFGFFHSGRPRRPGSTRCRRSQRPPSSKTTGSTSGSPRSASRRSASSSSRSTWGRRCGGCGRRGWSGAGRRSSPSPPTSAAG